MSAPHESTSVAVVRVTGRPAFGADVLRQPRHLGVVDARRWWRDARRDRPQRDVVSADVGIIADVVGFASPERKNNMDRSRCRLSTRNGERQTGRARLHGRPTGSRVSDDYGPESRSREIVSAQAAGFQILGATVGRSL